MPPEQLGSLSSPQHHCGDHLVPFLSGLTWFAQCNPWTQTRDSCVWFSQHSTSVVCLHCHTCWDFIPFPVVIPSLSAAE